MKIKVLLSSSLLMASQTFTFSTPVSAATAPTYTVSRYVTNPSNASNWGAAAGKSAVASGPSFGTIILDFGQPQTWTSNYGSIVYGTKLVNNQTLESTSQIATTVENFLSGFWANTPVNGPFIKVIVGTSNSSGTTNSDHGNAWASMVNSINSWISSSGYGGQEEAVGGSDMEIGWNTASNTRAWVDGYNNSGNYQLVDFGDDAGGANPGKNGWTANDVWYVAYGGRLNYPLPEMYYTVDATLDWGPLNSWAITNKGSSMFFMGTLTEYAADNTSLTPSAGWNALYNTVGSDHIGNMSTDITWSN